MLVTDLAYDMLAIAQLYRDRGDAENAFDELKNQWGWGGFTTHDLKRCRLTAMTVALAYNWWSLFVRLAHPQARLEAITSRPFLLSGDRAHDFPCRTDSLVDHADARKGNVRPSAAHRGEPAVAGLEKICGAVARRLGVAARVRVHRHSRDRIQLARHAIGITLDALAHRGNCGF